MQYNSSEQGYTATQQHPHFHACSLLGLLIAINNDRGTAEPAAARVDQFANGMLLHAKVK